jgi:enoyl-CoA hydratase
MGLVNHVYAPADLLPKTIELAQSISRNSFTAVSGAKRLLNEFSETVGLNSKLDAEAMAFGQLFGSHDQREGMGAFVEKRKPAFQGL